MASPDEIVSRPAIGAGCKQTLKPQNNKMNATIKKTVKKIFKAGMFHNITAGRDHISYKYHNRVFSFQITNFPFVGCGYFRSGYVWEGEILAPTYESEYNSLEMIKTAVFKPDYETPTDNPDYILRASNHLIN